MKQFILKTIGYSTKRIITLFAGALLGAVVIASLFGIIVPDIAWYSLVSIILGHSTLGTIGVFSNKQTNNKEDENIKL
jgi:hypothetical protein